MNKRMTPLREKNDSELHEEILQLRRELFNLRMQKAAGQNQKTSELRRVRRAIARALTLRAQRELETGAPAVITPTATATTATKPAAKKVTVEKSVTATATATPATAGAGNE